MKIVSHQIHNQDDAQFSKLIVNIIIEEKDLKFISEFLLLSEDPLPHFFKNPKITNHEGHERDCLENELVMIYEYFFPRLQEENKFLNYHLTGHLPETSYSDDDAKFERMTIDSCPILIKQFTDTKGETIYLRKSNEKLKYVKKDENDNIIRDENGMATYLSDAEMLAKNLLMVEPSVKAFNDKNECVGYSSDEWGADGVWVKSCYQKRGIGTEILIEFRSQFPKDRRIGQMTPAGMNMARSYYRRLHGQE